MIINSLLRTDNPLLIRRLPCKEADSAVLEGCFGEARRFLRSDGVYESYEGIDPFFRRQNALFFVVFEGNNAINNFDHALCAGYAQTVVVVTGGADGSSGRESRELSRMTGCADNDKSHINPLFFAQ